LEKKFIIACFLSNDLLAHKLHYTPQTHLQLRKRKKKNNIASFQASNFRICRGSSQLNHESLVGLTKIFCKTDCAAPRTSFETKPMRALKPILDECTDFYSDAQSSVFYCDIVIDAALWKNTLIYKVNPQKQNNVSLGQLNSSHWWFHSKGESCDLNWGLLLCYHFLSPGKVPDVLRPE
jgi:hypothetical protein